MHSTVPISSASSNTSRNLSGSNPRSLLSWHHRSQHQRRASTTLPAELTWPQRLQLGRTDSASSRFSSSEAAWSFVRLEACIAMSAPRESRSTGTGRAYLVLCFRKIRSPRPARYCATLYVSCMSDFACMWIGIRKQKSLMHGTQKGKHLAAVNEDVADHDHVVQLKLFPARIHPLVDVAMQLIEVQNLSKQCYDRPTCKWSALFQYLKVVPATICDVLNTLELQLGFMEICNAVTTNG